MTRPYQLGSDEHKQRFCHMLLDTFNPYKPTVIAWPTLSADALARLTNLPFWDIAVQTEGYASRRMQALADVTFEQPIKDALNLNAFEEGRHKLVIEHMLRFYGIKTVPEPDYAAPENAEWNFIRTGYSECFDSFFAFGLFKVAKDSGFFPPELVDVFEPVVHEEGRHILFFVNWVAWKRAQNNLFQNILFSGTCMAALGLSMFNRLGLAGKTKKAGQGVGARSGGGSFTMTGTESVAGKLSPRLFLETCLAENNRRMAEYDDTLLRPTLMPRLAKLALLFVR
ncbi:MAG: ferritin-like domain-containing protein [Alphaproteobacteria bacterium]|nr:ferritin-like domain-containing protein [Alphaproteobacteria bacterium]NDC55908.1 ferritin-like domain-containing protein [Alphaproteobacteria bacterium]NDG03895.1 ferritin-like domain-containing protein [Alphaproteobacteria bacterium]